MMSKSNTFVFEGELYYHLILIIIRGALLTKVMMNKPPCKLLRMMWVATEYVVHYFCRCPLAHHVILKTASELPEENPDCSVEVFLLRISSNRIICLSESLEFGLFSPRATLQLQQESVHHRASLWTKACKLPECTLSKKWIVHPHEIVHVCRS